MKKYLAIVALAGSVVFVAGCSSASTGGTASAATTSTSTGSPDSASAPSSSSSSSSSSMADSGSSTTSSAPSSSDDSTTRSESTESSSAEESTTKSSSEESTTSTAAVKVLDDQSTKWLTTYCTTVLPITKLSNIQRDITAAKGNLPKLKVIVLNAFQTTGAALTATATKLKGAPAPSLVKVGSNLTGLLSKIGTLGTTLTADGKKIAPIDPVKNPQAFATAIQKYAPDLERISTVLGTGAGLKIPLVALPEIKRIPACTKVITTA